MSGTCFAAATDRNGRPLRHASYDAVTKTRGPGGPSGSGARLIGGCCRTTPRDIAAVAMLSTKR
ncbi:homocysteine S-methyltransferase family protein [Arthrobacter sp. 2RAF6]